MAEKPGRKVSTLLATTRAYEAAHNRAERARAAAAKLAPLAEELAAAEAEEVTARGEYVAAVTAEGIVAAS